MSSAFLRLFPVSITTPCWGESSYSSSHPSNHSNKLIYEVSDIYRRRVTDTQKISPYDAGACPNYPAITNILYIPFDTYHTFRALYSVTKQGDYEGMQDASARLLGTPANCISAFGTILEWGLGFKILPASLITLLPLTYIFGVLLCVIEGAVDTFSLFRQHDFRKSFDLDLLSDLKILIEEPEALTNYETVKKLIGTLSKEHIQALFPDQGKKEVIEAFKTLKQELENESFYRRHIIQSHSPQIKEIAERILFSNLVNLQKDYLQLNPEEVKDVCEKTWNKYQDKPMEAQLDKLQENLNKALEVKKMRLARRIRPWMVEEASLKTQDIIEGLINKEPKIRQEALKEGLALMKDINTQSKKKNLIHMMGVIALIIATVSIITMAVGCPVIVPYILIGVATTVALIRFLAYKGMLDLRGWDFSIKHFLPDCITKG